MGFNPTFYAGRPKLSEVTIDSDLNMGGRDISGVDTIGVDTIGVDTILANEVRAARVYSPIDTDEWPTETLVWPGDVPASDTVVIDNGTVSTTWQDTTVYTATKTVDLTPVWTCESGASIYGLSEIRLNGTAVTTLGADLAPGNTKTFPKMRLNSGDVLLFRIAASATAKITCRLLDDGFYIGAKTLNLTGKWLALGIDMQGLAATVKIQGVTMPYSDYPKYFPIAPTELTVPEAPFGTTRPVIKVYT